MAGINNSTLYPPIVDTMMPAFIYDQGECRVYFSLSKINSYNEIDINKVQVMVNDQTTNLSQLDKSLYPRGIKLAHMNIDDSIQGDDKYYITLYSSDIENGFQPGKYYKVQIRFTSVNAGSTSAGFPRWLQDNKEYFSEWSTICLVYCITKPSININFFGMEKTGSYFVTQDNIDIEGEVSFNEASEYLKSYTITILSGNEIILNTDTIYTSYNYISYTLNKNLNIGQEYQLILSIESSHGYTESINCFFTVVQDETLSFDFDVAISAKNDAELGGIIVESYRIKQKGDEDIPFYGNITYRRASSEDNFSTWEDIKTKAISVNDYKDSWIDITTKSGVKYIYSVQRRSIKGNRGRSISMLPEEAVLADFEDIYFIAEGKNLRIRFNPNISSYKINVMDSKTDTIGSKYPFIKRNGNNYYRAFSISGVISLQSDYYNADLPLSASNSEQLISYYAEEEVNNQLKLNELPKETWYSIWNNKAIEDSEVHLYNYNMKRVEKDNQVITTFNNSTPSDIIDSESYILEREYRDKVIEFLYKNNIKLMKTDTEGNFLVRLMDVSLSPFAIGRQLYQFSATAYEIDDYNLYNIDKYNIFKKGDLQDVYKDDLILGQHIYRGENENLIDILKDKYSAYYANLNCQTSIESIRFVRIEIDKEQEPYMTSCGLLGYEVLINGVKVYIRPDQICYELRGSDIQVTSLQFTQPMNVLIDYVVHVSTTEDVSKLHKNFRHELRVGQIYDIYIKDTDILKLIKDKYTYQYQKEYCNVLSIDQISIEAEEGVTLDIGFNDNPPSSFEINDYNLLNLCDKDQKITYCVLKVNHDNNAYQALLKAYQTYCYGLNGQFISLEDIFIGDIENQVFYALSNESSEQEDYNNLKKAYEDYLKTIHKVKVLIDYCIELEKGEYY